MTDLVVYRPVKEQSLAARARQIVARIAQAIERALVAARIQRELSALPINPDAPVTSTRFTGARSCAIPDRPIDVVYVTHHHANNLN